MAVTPQTTIRLLKVPLEIDNKNQITFASEQAQRNYFLSLPHLEIDECSYQRKDNIMYFPEHIDNLLEYNYVMYLNENYTNKWFYAFIDKMEYETDYNTAIHISTDVYQTWQFNLTFKKSFVEREHVQVSDDIVGKHTIPENLETGEYICNEHYKDITFDDNINDFCFIMASTSEPIGGEAKDTVAPSGIYNGIYTGLAYYRYDNPIGIDTILSTFATAGKTDAINGIFMAPKFLAPLSSSGTPALYRQVAESDDPVNYAFTLNKQQTLNGYTPRNQKLKCFPYNYLVMSNNIGQNSILHYEKFDNPGDDVCDFRVDGVLCPGCSIKITPRFYNGSDNADDEAISLGKLPICNFQNDMYTNWLTQNSINVLGNTITTDDLNMANSALSSAVGTATNLAVGNYVGAGMSLASGVSGITNSLIQQKQHNMISPSLKGSLNSADINVANGNNTFHFYKMSIKEEYARILDNYFDMFGYKVNDVKIPNLTGRPNWNYVKTIDCNITGNIPQEDMQTIKNIFNNGVTLWHNTSTFLDYSQNNR